jgi:hypothetical protein
MAMILVRLYRAWSFPQAALVFSQREGAVYKTLAHIYATSFLQVFG